ncbi:dihydrolipoamide acetyltransferase family protein [Agromyces salentinus]|uniref:Dihydrolipoamide acetyltransferase component of pyruvate dehydrogenase complex n=1 Tax=Agromyces salentinus TaxID=269421 RepID=A0ABN2MZ11_9MICO|nr:dihydrolipoamide acetyltransferase family protein [Agromyces salentinus]
MNRDFILPDLGEGLTEAEVVAWLVQPGDEVRIDQPVVELESAKSVVQLPTPFAGVVAALGGEVGQVLHAGQVLLSLAQPEAADAAEPNAAPTAQAGTGGGTNSGAESPATAQPAEPGIVVAESAPAEESGAVLIGYGTRASAPTVRSSSAPSRFGRGRGSGPAEPAGSPDGEGPASTATAILELDPARRSPVVSPLVRRLAREHGFDASRLEGSGPQHLVVRRDVESFIARRGDGPIAVPAPAAAPAPAADASAAPSGHRDAEADAAEPGRTSGERRVPLDRLQKAAAAQFTRSRREIPDATVWMDVDATGLFEARRDLLAATGESFGITALVARFTVAALVRHPSLNAAFDAERDEIVFHDDVHLGMAAQTPRGLVVPVVHGAGRMSLRVLRDAIAERTEQASSGRFPPSALSGGTFTLNNYGTLGVDGSAAIINHPQAAMLGIGRIVERPWVVDGALAVRRVTELTVSFDHRVCDGAEAAAFLTEVARSIERPVSVLADL